MTRILSRLLALCLAGAGWAGAASFDDTPFSRLGDNSVLLCFDLRSTITKPAGAILVRGLAEGTPKDILLPFAATEIGHNRNLLITAGTYSTFSLVRVASGRGPGTSIPISFALPLQNPPRDLPLLGGFPPGIYYQEQGLERLFVFQDNTAEQLAELKSEFPHFRFEGVEAVALALPANAEGREVKKGMTVVPSPVSESQGIMLFKGGAKTIAVRYVVPPTLFQEAVANSLMKLLFVMALPVLTVIFLPPAEVQRPNFRKWFIGISVLGQCIALVAFIWVVTAMRGLTATATSDLLLAACGLIFQVAILYIKSKPGESTGDAG